MPAFRTAVNNNLHGGGKIHFQGQKRSRTEREPGRSRDPAQ